MGGDDGRAGGEEESDDGDEGGDFHSDNTMLRWIRATVNISSGADIQEEANSVGQLDESFSSETND